MKLTATQLRRIIKEEASFALGNDDKNRFLHGYEEGHPHDDEGYMMKSRVASLKKMAAELCDLVEKEDQLPGWVQDLVATSHADLQHVHNYLMNDEAMRSRQKAPRQMIPTMESASHRKGMMLEGHSRITPEEMRAWMGGNWGYSEGDDEDLD